MDELAVVVIVLILGMGWVAAVVAAIAALVRTGKIENLQRRLVALELAVERIERELRSLGQRGAASGATTSVPPETHASPHTAGPHGAGAPISATAPAGPSSQQTRPTQAGGPTRADAPTQRGAPFDSSPVGAAPPGTLASDTAAPPDAVVGASAPRTKPAGSPQVATPPGSTAPVGATPPGSAPPLGRPPLLPPSAPPVTIDWERFLGVRGAAILGGAVLALAGLLLFQYSIQHGLVTPSMRVTAGVVVGLACLAGSEWLRRLKYAFTPEATGGAGVVILYASFWSAHELYALISQAGCFGLLVGVTVVCCLLSLRHRSQVVAILGLVGGFAAPVLVRTETDHPIGLFGYVLLLDLGLLAIARGRRWPYLGVLSLVGTVLLQGLWIVARMGPERVGLGLGVLCVFALLFAAAGQIAPAGERRAWLMSQAGAILMPFVFALYFAGRVDLGPRLYPVAILLALLAVAAGWIARVQSAPMLAVGAAAGCAAVVGLWLATHALSPALAWETVIAIVVLSAIFHVFVELRPDEAGANGPAWAAILAASVLFAESIVASARAQSVPLWPWLAGWLTLSALLVRHARFRDRAPLQVFAAIGLALGLSFHHLMLEAQPGFAGWDVFLGVTLAVSALARLPAWLARRGMERDGHEAPEPGPASFLAFANHAAAVLPALVLLSLCASQSAGQVSPSRILLAELALGVLVAVSATRLGAGSWYAAGAGLCALAHLAWTAQRFDVTEGLFDWLESQPGGAASSTGGAAGLAAGSGSAGAALSALGIGLLGSAIFTLWPFFANRALLRTRWAWYAAALAAPAWFLALRRLFSAGFGDGFIGVLPLLLGGLTLAAAMRSRTHWSADDPMRMSALAWFSAVALGFLSVAIPLQLSKEWITIGWAIEGLAVAALWTRLDHPGLKYFSLALLGATTARLILNPAIFGYYARSGVRILNWLSYAYLVPVSALFGAARLLRRHEVSRARAWEQPLYRTGHPVGSNACTMAGILTIFVWINLTIVDWFATGPYLRLHLRHAPACDLTMSIAWAVFALGILGFGMVGASSALRWVSLSFLILTIGKVFLYDLGELKDLYRVASLVGLAISLLLVSLLYQRFVFRKKDAGG